MHTVVSFILLTVLIMTGFPLTKQSFPICYSYDSLCDVTFDMSSMNLPESTGSICRCPGKISCEAAKKDPQRTLTVESMFESGEKMTITLTYCDARTFSTRKCKQNELVVKLREVGTLGFKIKGDISCICTAPLVLRKSVPDWIASTGTYTCGTPTCEINMTVEPVCGRLKRRKAGLESKFPCQCPAEYHCLIDVTKVPDFLGGSAEFYCQPNKSDFGIVY